MGDWLVEDSFLDDLIWDWKRKTHITSDIHLFQGVADFSCFGLFLTLQQDTSLLGDKTDSQIKREIIAIEN